jgi:hypothetical protein
VRRPGGAAAAAARVSEGELRSAFALGWQLETLRADTFEINPGPFFGSTQVQAWLAIIGPVAAG